MRPWYTLMSYPGAPSSGQGAPAEAEVRDFLLDLGARKEFRALARPAASDSAAESRVPHPFGFGLPGGPSAPVSPAIPGLRLHGAQVFVSNFSNPDTPYTRLLLNWQTGTGKSIGAISIAQEYVRQFRSRITVSAADRPTVFVVGFTKAIIQAEMLRHPEFGFVSPEEVAELRRLHLLAEASGGAATPEARHHAGYVGVLKRRITDRSRGGYYQFYGYKEFANRLFVATRRGSARGFSVANLYAREAADEAVEEVTFLERIDAAVEAGDVEVNRDLLADLRGGLIVADEIHNTYNIQTKNNYGVAIQYALDKIAAEDPGGAPRALFMSATVTGGVATEIVDLLNFLVPAAHLPGGRRLRRSEFFQTAGAESGRRSVALLPGALDRIGRLSAGRVSFLLDTDEASYPRRIFEGVGVPDPYRPGADIAYLRFTPCPMSAFHERTLAQMLAGAAGDRAAIPANAYTLYDMAYPNPDFAPDAAGDPGSEAVGLYLSAETPAKLAAAPTEWKAAAGVTVESLRGGPGVRAGVPSLISGPFLDLSGSDAKGRPGLRAYSAKFQALGEALFDIVRGGPGKVMIYHHRVRMSGVLQIQEILEVNGFLDETSAPSPSTVCAVCGTARRDHSAKAAAGSWAGAHEFAPARYVMINSEIDRSVLERSIARFNAQSNVEGFEYRVLIGSKIIREGFDLKAVRHQLIASLPTDIPTLIQVFGRAVRKGSHLGLPEDQRDVRIRIFVSTAGTPGGAAPEVARYAEKMEAYFLTQEVETAVRRYAVDAFINYDRMVAADPSLLETPSIDAIPYRPAVSRAEALARPQTTATFEAYGHGDREVEVLKAVIRALFETRPVWTYDDLWAAVRAGGVAGVAQDPASFAEDSFALALEALGRHSPHVTRLRATPAQMGGESLISRVGDFYVRGPAGPAGQPVLDVESYVRDNVILAPLRIRVADYVQVSRRTENFAVRLAEFELEFGAADSRIEDMFFRYDADFHYALLRAIVEGAGTDSGAASDADAAAIFRKTSATNSALGRALDAYVRFKVVVLGGDVAGSPEAKKVARSSRAIRAGGKTPVGYVAEASVRLRAEGEWYDIPRKALGVGTRYAENDVAVGYVERRGANLRFKVRPPIHELSAADVRDVRSLSRGAVCETRPRPEQEDLALRLKAPAAGRAPKTKADLGGLSSADLCAAIRARLMALEEASRNRKTGMLDGVRWFYLFNDRLPTITLGR